jgi:excisionase family DNA binding protein
MERRSFGTSLGDDDQGVTWVDIAYLSAALGVNKQRVQQLIAADKLPAERTPSGKRWRFRKDQVDVVINARIARRLRD